MKRIIYSIFVLFVFLISATEVSAISGSTTACVGSTNTYTLSTSSSYTIGWTWSISSGATIVSGQGTKTITVNFTSACGANLNVTGHGITENLVIISYEKPSSVGPITGPTTVCKGQTGVTYRFPSVLYANGYSWIAASGGMTIAYQGGTSAVFNFPSTFTGGVIVCYAIIPSCGATAAASLTISACSSIPGAAGSISGKSAVCYGESATYTVPAIAGATGYTWTLPSGTIKTTTTNSVTVDFSTEASGLLKVSGINACGSGSTSTTGVTVNTYPVITVQPASISVRMAGTATFKVTASGNNMSYQWRKNSVAISGATSSTYTINNVQNTDLANYDVIITSGCCSVTSNIAALRVLFLSDQNDKNYILSRDVQVKNITSKTSTDYLTIGEIRETVQYFDGLGRLIQNVSTQESPNKEDIIQSLAYDIYGREEKKYLPYISGTTGYYKTNDLADPSSILTDPLERYRTGAQYNFYQNNGPVTDQYPYSGTTFENSPLNRALVQGSPGNDWQPEHHSVKMDYKTNTSSDVRLWVVNDDNSITTTGYYNEGSLYKTVIKDENWISGSLNTTEEYKDIIGNVVLKRNYVTIKKEDGTSVITPVETYYIYDDYGLLRYVLTPQAVNNLGTKFTLTQSDLLVTNLCYYYKYDSKKRMIIKQLPGADPVYLVYDNRDRLIAVQDAVQRNAGKWLITKYDQLDRPIMNGLKSIPDNLDALQAYLNSYLSTSLYYETRISSGVGYTLNSSFSDKLTLTESELLSVTYYDTYDYPGKKEFISDTILRVSNYYNKYSTTKYYSGTTRSLVTGTRVKVLDGNENSSSGYKWLVSTNYYDDKYRLIQTVRDLYSPTTTDNEIISTQYDFSGKVLKTLTRQIFMGNINITTNTMSYDHVGRVLKVKHKVNNDDDITIASMEYNELGQLKRKTLNGDLGSGIQDLNYTYNIRGWLEKINDPSTNPTLTSNQKFNMGLYYNTVPTGLSASPQYNGNIAAMVWNTPINSDAKSPADKQGYGFTYDGLNRLTTSVYGEGTGFGSYAGVLGNNESYSYDLNGNIRSLTRYLKGTGIIDNLTYTYKNGNVSNLLDRVDDSSLRTEGFSDGASQANEYVYDGNGNLISDSNKGYTSILYNYLDLPRQVGTQNQYISYIYNAIGTKVAKISTTGDYTYYNGNFVYEGTSLTSSLSYIIHSEGIMTPGSGYSYFLKDHLGNTRMVVNTNGTGGTIEQQTDYYPFGMSIAESNGSINKYLYNGKELQEDVINNIKLGWYDYGARFYDAQIGRFTTQDAYAEKYLDFSPYQYAANNPLKYIDINGDSIFVYSNGQKYYYGYTEKYGYGMYDQSGQLYSGNDQTLNSVNSALARISLGSEGKTLVDDLMNNNNGTTILAKAGYKNQTDQNNGSFVLWDPGNFKGGPDQNGSTTRDPYIGLAHELGHVQDIWNGTMQHGIWQTVTDEYNTKHPIEYNEIYATHIENKIRAENGLPLRVSYGVNSGGPDNQTRIIRAGTSQSIYLLESGIISFKFDKKGNVSYIPLRKDLTPFIYK